MRGIHAWSLTVCIQICAFRPVWCLHCFWLIDKTNNSFCLSQLAVKKIEGQQNIHVLPVLGSIFWAMLN